MLSAVEEAVTECGYDVKRRVSEKIKKRELVSEPNSKVLVD